MKIKRILAKQAMKEFAREQIRIVWNPKSNLWFAYPLMNECAHFSTHTIELHTVSVYGEVKPTFAPQGTPSFVGTVAEHMVLDPDTAKPIYRHPYAPAKLFVSMDVDNTVPFTTARRLLLVGPKMYFKPNLGISA